MKTGELLVDRGSLGDSLFDALPIGVAVCDLAGRIVRRNRALTDLMGRGEAGGASSHSRAAAAPRPSRGLGLGLHICRVLVAAHGGTIDAESTGGTTTFSFTLPAA